MSLKSGSILTICIFHYFGQILGCLQIIMEYGLIQSCPALAILLSGIYAHVLDQGLYHLGAADTCSFKQWGIAMLVRQVRIGALLEQEYEQLLSVKNDGIMEQGVGAIHADGIVDKLLSGEDHRLYIIEVEHFDRVPGFSLDQIIGYIYHFLVAHIYTEFVLNEMWHSQYQ